jgi:hypothetical protein
MLLDRNLILNVLSNHCIALHCIDVNCVAKEKLIGTDTVPYKYTGTVFVN